MRAAHDLVRRSGTGPNAGFHLLQGRSPPLRQGRKVDSGAAWAHEDARAAMATLPLPSPCRNDEMVFLYDLTMPEILRRIAAALIYAGLQGGILGLLLRVMGDRRAHDEGRAGFSPFSHLLLSGVFLSIAFRMSWIEPLRFAKPAPSVRTRARLRPLVAVLASFAILLALVPLLDLVRAPLHQALPRTAGYMVLATIETLQFTLVGSVALGMLPLPGLLLGTTLPAIRPALDKRYRKLAGIGMALAAVIVVLGWFPDVSPLVRALKLV